MVIKSLAYNKVIKYKQVATERIEDYRELVQELITEWRMILAIVSDWKRWVLWWFGNLPTQMCIFHQQRIFRRNLGKNNKLLPNIELKIIYEHIGKVDKEWLEIALNERFIKHKTRLLERNYDWKFIHERTRKTYRSLKRNMQRLYVFEQNPHLNIPTTTNALDWWVFSWLKSRIRVHRGMNKENVIRFVSEYMNNH